MKIEDRPELRICGHCRLQMAGFASKGDTWLCHPDEGLDCYRLVTVYKHSMPCYECKPHLRWGSTWDEVKARLAEGWTLEQWQEWNSALAAAKVRYRSEIRKYRGIDRLRAMYRKRKR